MKTRLARVRWGLVVTAASVVYIVTFLLQRDLQAVLAAATVSTIAVWALQPSSST